MDDLISRQAALEKVRTMQTYKLSEGDDMILVDKTDVQTELMMLSPVQPEVIACGNGELIAQPEAYWIPVSERLPEKCGEYLVSVHHTIGAISVFHPEKNTYVDDVAIMKYYGKFPSTVRAWMPLPEAYKPNK